MVTGKVFAAIGNFDGVHRGHQFLLQQAIALASTHNMRPGVVLFDPHPRRFFQPETEPFLLTASARRDALLRACGIEVIHALTFDTTLSSLSANAFIEDILIDQLDLGGVMVGAEFRFGKGRGGDVALLSEVCARRGVVMETVTPMDLGTLDLGTLDLGTQRLDTQGRDHQSADKIGSSKIRQALQDGDIKGANAMLGRCWDVTGPVIEGQKLGRTLGFPTANMLIGDLIAPRHGVYAVKVAIKGEGTHAPYRGIANFGRKPTVGTHAPLLEVHIFDFSGDLYAKELNVTFEAFLREERKFDGLDALKAQISRDCDQARAVLTL